MARTEASTHPNIELVRSGHAAFDRGDLETIKRIFDPDIHWHLPGKSRFAGDYKGVDEVLGMFGRVLQFTGGVPRNTYHDFLANDDHAIAWGTRTGEANGKKLNVRFVHIQRIRDGKITESWMFTDDQYAVDDFYS